MNGPIIMLDKSAFQSLSKSESFLLHKYFFVNVPPILVLEILGDLKKLSQKKDPRKLVSEYAGKLLLSGTFVNTHFGDLLSSSLVGNEVLMDGRLVVQPGRSSRVSGQGDGVVINSAPEAEAVLRWKAGEFHKSEEVLAERWREITRSIDLERLQRELRARNSDAQRIQTPEELLAAVDAGLANVTDPLVTLRGLFEELGVEQKTMARATQRWQLSGYSSFADFAPYALHCVRVSLFFYLGLLHNCPFIGTRATNRVDLEYLFYLPFCDVLASGDDFHARICGVFLREDQSFVTRDALKADLTAIDLMWARFLPYQKAYIWPPEREGSVVLDLWRKHVAPVRTNDQDQASLLSKEQNDFIMAKLRPLIAEASSPWQKSVNRVGSY